MLSHDCKMIEAFTSRNSEKNWHLWVASNGWLYFSDRLLQKSILFGKVHKTTQHIIRDLSVLTRDMASQRIECLPPVKQECIHEQDIFNGIVAHWAQRAVWRLKTLNTDRDSVNRIQCGTLMRKHEQHAVLLSWFSI